jgi:putative sugar O-methyltransferase
MKIFNKISKLIRYLNFYLQSNQSEKKLFSPKNWVEINYSESESGLKIANELINIYYKITPPPFKLNQSNIWKKQIFGKSLSLLKLHLTKKNASSVNNLLLNFWNSEDSFLGATYTNKPKKILAKLAEILVLYQMYFNLKKTIDIELSDLSYLSLCGNPSGLRYKNTIINHLSIRQAFDVQQISKLVSDGDVVLEIGGGHGSLAGKLSNKKKITYIDIDLPESLYSAYYFLRISLPNIRILFCTSSDEVINIKNLYKDFDIFLIPNYLSKYLNKIELAVIFNSYSLSEMRITDIEEYMNLIEKLKPNFFLSENYTADRNIIEDTNRSLINSRNFKPKGYKIISETKSIDYRNSDCRRFLYIKHSLS